MQKIWSAYAGWGAFAAFASGKWKNDIGRLARNEIHGQFPEEMFTSARCFHTCGITLALDEKVRETAVTLMRKFKEHGTLISFDVKFRGNLWSVWKHWSGGQDWKRRCLYCRCFVWNFEISRRSVTGSIYRKRSKRPEEYRPRRFSGNGSLRDSWTDSGT